jgi:LAO/AO transport system kinase
MVDFFLLLMLSGAGDELQGIKRGIMEMADAIVINKADGENIRKAQAAATEYRNALGLFPQAESQWRPPVQTCSSLSKDGVPGVWEIISSYREHTQGNGYFDLKRRMQSKVRMHQTIAEQLNNHFYRDAKIVEMIPSLEKALDNNSISAYVAARKLLDAYYADLSVKKE